MKTVALISRRMAALSTVLLALAANACDRALIAPAAPTGLNVVLNKEEVAGVFPDFLRHIGKVAGCEFNFPVMPRPRLDRMFFANEADVLAPATQTASRDKQAVFIPWMELKPQLITFRLDGSLVPDVPSLLARLDWRGVVVRSYSWGDKYDALIKQLDSEHRLDSVSDLKTVHAMLRAGRVKFTILPASLLYSETYNGHVATGMKTEFKYTNLRDLPNAKVGIYVSPVTVANKDIAKLRAAIELGRKDGSLRRILQSYYPQEIIETDMILN
jgi:polar amino acid transport system substrate-binding protein